MYQEHISRIEHSQCQQYLAPSQARFFKFDKQDPSKPKTTYMPGGPQHPGAVRESPLAGKFLPAPPPVTNIRKTVYTKYDFHDYNDDDTCNTDMSDDTEDPEDLDYVDPSRKSRKVEERSSRMLAYSEAYPTTPRGLSCARPARAMLSKSVKKQGQRTGREGQGLPPAGPDIITPTSHPEYVGFLLGGGPATGGSDERQTARDLF